MSLHGFFYLSALSYTKDGAESTFLSSESLSLFSTFPPCAFGSSPLQTGSSLSGGDTEDRGSGAGFWPSVDEAAAAAE